MSQHSSPDPLSTLANSANHLSLTTSDSNNLEEPQTNSQQQTLANELQRQLLPLQQAMHTQQTMIAQLLSRILQLEATVTTQTSKIATLEQQRSNASNATTEPPPPSRFPKGKKIGINNAPRKSRNNKPIGPIDILLVDDIDLTLKMNHAALTRGHYKVDVASDGLSAIELFKKNMGSLKAVLMDIHLPGISGIETTEMIRKLEIEAGVQPVWIYGLTADVADDDLVKYKACGMNGCILKGKLLADAVKQAMEESQNGVEFVNLCDNGGGPSSCSSSSSAPSSPVTPVLSDRHHTSSPFNGPNLLLVEDIPVSRKNAVHALQRAGYRVIEAEDGEEAVEKWKQNQGSLKFVLMDINLPGIFGLEATEQIRAAELASGTSEPVFIFGLTGNVDRESMRNYESAGMNGCILKGKGLAEAVKLAIEEAQEGRFVNIS